LFLAHLELAGAGRQDREPDYWKEIWTFFPGFSALLDRGRVWIVGTEDGKETSRLAISCGGAQEKLT
jgi:hypothetical protein